ncbi:MAG: class I SAM-dependent methyltransferase [Solirubrobacterales bacterium]|nr:class I SAM-dependent methyltransferase [Solirubrobacterales bacterium]
MTELATDRRSIDEERFEFGQNWTRFLSVVDGQRISEAERSLIDMLGQDRLNGMTLLDIGCGSGLFSLAAVRLGAARVHSFDFDRQSVAACEELRRRHAPEAKDWTIEEGSILDGAYVEQLGRWDVVYAWGVLHHTGDMERALEHAGELVTPGGRLFIAIYNDQGWKSHAWRCIKRLCVTLPAWLQGPYAAVVYLPFELRGAVGSLLRLHPQRYWCRWTQYGRHARGMSHWHDVMDWVGGYPFEVATPERIFDFYVQRGFTLLRLATKGASIGCNEYVFLRAPLASASLTAGAQAAAP